MERRLARLEQRIGAGEPERGQIQFVDVTTWPDVDQEHYRVGTPEQRAALIEAHTGRKPPPPGRLVRMVIDVAPAPMDPIAAIAEADRLVRQETGRCP